MQKARVTTMPPAQNKRSAVMMCALAALLLYGVSAGIRGDIGILLNPLSQSTGCPYQYVSFAIAVMQLAFGVFQPLFGILAVRRSDRFVLILGIVLYLLGTAALPFIRSMAGLLTAVGLLLGAGAGAVSFGVILSAYISAAGPEYGAVISGMINAAAGIGSTVLAALMQGSLSRGGLSSASALLSLSLLLLVPFTLYMTHLSAGNAQPRSSSDAKSSFSAQEIFRSAFADRTFRLLLCGFSTCGFHMAIIEAHLFSQFLSYGIDRRSTALAFGVYGLATVAGSLISGFFSARFPRGKMLGIYYGFRAVWAAAYLFSMPKNFFTACLFSIGLGLTGAATVPPTSGLVNRQFPLRWTAALMGFLFMCHQIGAFLSASLGGICAARTGSYITIWCIDMLLCSFASLASFRI